MVAEVRGYCSSVDGRWLLCFFVVSLGNFLCSLVAGRSNVARRVSREARRAVLETGLSPLGSLAMSAFVGEIWRV